MSFLIEDKDMLNPASLPAFSRFVPKLMNNPGLWGWIIHDYGSVREKGGKPNTLYLQFSFRHYVIFNRGQRYAQPCIITCIFHALFQNS
jgi:hypothetical protein